MAHGQFMDAEAKVPMTHLPTPGLPDLADTPYSDILFICVFRLEWKYFLKFGERILGL